MQESVFELLGKKETALTRSLAILLKAKPDLLLKLYNKAKKTGQNWPFMTKKSLDNLVVSAENTENDDEKTSRFDIRCSNSKWDVVVEAKVGNNSVENAQISKYKSILEKSDAQNKVLLTLTEVPQRLNPIKNVVTGTLHWLDVLEILKNEKCQVDLAEHMKNLLKVRCMNFHDIEVWAVSIKEKSQKENLENGFYIHDGLPHNPMMIAPREEKKISGGKTRSCIERLYPVIEVFEKESPEWNSLVNTLRDCGSNFHIYKLGNPIELKKKMGREKPFSQSSAISVKFQELIDLE